MRLLVARCYLNQHAAMKSSKTRNRTAATSLSSVKLLSQVEDPGVVAASAKPSA
jgi:hypothetical protein